jgi:hypothetical protein
MPELFGDKLGGVLEYFFSVASLKKFSHPSPTPYLNLTAMVKQIQIQEMVLSWFPVSVDLFMFFMLEYAEAL